MTQAVKGKTAKAWKLVKDSLQDDDAYHKLRNGFPIQLTGSSGTLYIVYPSGRFVKVGLEQPKIGEMVSGSYYASPDYLATIISWIRFNEEQLEKNWKCGRFRMHEPVREGVGQRELYRMHARRRDSSDWIVPIAMLLVTVVASFFVVPQIAIWFEGSLIATEGAEAGNISTMTDVLSDFIPLILPIAMVCMLLSLMKSFARI